MGENYGVSFAHKLNEQGLWDDAIAQASKDIAHDGDDPDPFVERAVALAAKEQYLAAVTDLQKSLELDVAAQTLDTDFVDDTLFGALLGEARKQSDVQQGLAVLARYLEIFPKGRHLQDVDIWTRRLRGDDKDAIIVKEQGG